MFGTLLIAFAAYLYGRSSVRRESSPSLSRWPGSETKRRYDSYYAPKPKPWR